MPALTLTGHQKESFI